MNYEKRVKKNSEWMKDLFNDNYRENLDNIIRTGQENRIKQKYIDAIIAAVDARKNEKLQEVIFEGEGVNLKKIVEIVDKYNKVKDKYVKAFEEVKVVRKENN